MSTSYSREEVALHNTPADCWVIIFNKVYNLSKFLALHPGGASSILDYAGRDASEPFRQLHTPAVLAKYDEKLCIGIVASASSETSQRSALFPSAQPRRARDSSPGMIAASVSLPYTDPNAMQGWVSPYYNDTHALFRRHVRQFMDAEITPFCREWEEAGRVPPEVIRKCAEAGLLPLVCGLPWPTEYVDDRIERDGVSYTSKDLDTFHELVFIDETARCGSGGVLWAISGGLSIGLPPVIHFGSAALKEKCVRACLMGEKRICLAITEASGGSDVAHLQCRAEKTPCGRFYRVNGHKKWITGGVDADYFTTAVRTGDEESGALGVSLLLIERTFPGVKTTNIKCSGVLSSGTAFVTFENVMVPVENLIGDEGMGFLYIVRNFNHERWAIVAQCVRFARVCIEDALRWALKRKTFGKELIKHPVIRTKFADMIRQVEATQAWLEQVTHQLNVLPPEKQGRLAGSIALLKAHSSRVFEYCAREAQQILGGTGYTRGGQGERVERLARDVRAYAIPGGSEEIMLDLGMRQAMMRAAKM